MKPLRLAHIYIVGPLPAARPDMKSCQSAAHKQALKGMHPRRKECSLVLENLTWYESCCDRYGTYVLPHSLR